MWADYYFQKSYYVVFIGPVNYHKSISVYKIYIDKHCVIIYLKYI